MTISLKWATDSVSCWNHLIGTITHCHILRILWIIMTSVTMKTNMKVHVNSSLRTKHFRSYPMLCNSKWCSLWSWSLVVVTMNYQQNDILWSVMNDHQQIGMTINGMKGHQTSATSIPFFGRGIVNPWPHHAAKLKPVQCWDLRGPPVRDPQLGLKLHPFSVSFACLIFKPVFDQHSLDNSQSYWWWVNTPRKACRFPYIILVSFAAVGCGV